MGSRAGHSTLSQYYHPHSCIEQHAAQPICRGRKYQYVSYVLMQCSHNIHCIVLALYTDGNRGEVTFPLNIDDPTGLYHYRIMVNYVVCDQYLQCEDSITKNSCPAGHGRALRLRVCTFHDHPEPLSKIPRGRHEWSL